LPPAERVFTPAPDRWKYDFQATGYEAKMSKHLEYSARFDPAKEGGFVIIFPDFGWGVSQADTEEEAHEMAIALLQTLVQEHIRNGEAPPQPSQSRGRKFLFDPAPRSPGCQSRVRGNQHRSA
jgi:predicted RNase H-like HicB family nuclease